MSDQTEKNYTATHEVLPTDNGQGRSRRGFLKVGAAVAAGLLGACGQTPGSSDAHGEDEVGGSTGRGGDGSPGRSGGAGSNSSVSSAGSVGKGGSVHGGGASGKDETGDGGSSKTGSGGGSTAGTTKTDGTKGGSTGSGGATTKGDGGIAPKGDSGVAKDGGSANAGGSTPVDPDASHSGGTASTEEDHGASCKVGTIASKANAKLPDPFKFLDGTRISKKEDWACLRAELSAALQACIYGPKMPPPDSLKATYSGGSLSIDMTVGSNKKTVSVKITNAGSSSKKVPGLIVCGASSLPALSGAATITLDYNSWSAESSLSGIVQTLYGNTCAKSGALINWAWGTSRIIDALAQCPEAGIDLSAIAVTGCSRCGKGALAMGAFDERVALTLVQEGGSGGTALWRVSSKEKSLGENIQEATEIVGEQKWQGSDFKSYVNDVTKLPADQHFAVALCAPRAIMVFENDIDWLGPVATYGGAIAGRKVYEALGIKDRCGVSIAGNHSHCAFPSNQQKYFDAFTSRFLKGGKDDTNVDEFKASNTKLGSFKEADWIDWEVPTLSGSLAWDPFA